MAALDFKDAFGRTGWDRRTAADKIGVSLGTVDRALDAGKWSSNTERLFRLALEQHVDGIAALLAPAPGETAMVRIRLPVGGTLRIAVGKVRSLMDAGVLTLDDAGTLMVRPDAADSYAALFAVLHGRGEAADATLDPEGEATPWT